MKKVKMNAVNKATGAETKEDRVIRSNAKGKTYLCKTAESVNLSTAFRFSVEPLISANISITS